VVGLDYVLFNLILADLVNLGGINGGMVSISLQKLVFLCVFRPCGVSPMVWLSCGLTESSCGLWESSCGL
jgi:hypothetical protein